MLPVNHRPSTSPIASFRLMVLILAVSGVHPFAWAQESVTTPSAEATPEAGNPEQLKKSQIDRDSQTAAVGILLLVLTGVIGLTLFVLLLMWGHRIRTMVRQPLPAQSRQDEFWYLRPDKQLPPRDPAETGSTAVDASSDAGESDDTEDGL